MTDKEQIIATIKEVVNSNHWVKDRIAKLKEKGMEIDELVYEHNKRMAIEHLYFAPEGVSPSRVGKYPSGTR